jgi:hypothetical protein
MNQRSVTYIIEFAAFISFPSTLPAIKSKQPQPEEAEAKECEDKQRKKVLEVRCRAH